MTVTAPRAQLCIWTNIDPAFEADFNRWYDREHMQERVAIPGFRFARRFKAVHETARPYLALYCTQDASVFTSEAYARAFQNQTEWSLRNFARMQGTQRRVGTLDVEAGEGQGGMLAAFVLTQAVVAQARPRLDAQLAELAVALKQLAQLDQNNKEIIETYMGLRPRMCEDMSNLIKTSGEMSSQLSANLA